MTVFFPTSQNVQVSRINQDGWWQENTTEYVAKGTALGSDFTQNIYSPLKRGVTAQYDPINNSWSDEIEDATQLVRFDKNGSRIIVDSPDSHYPDNAIEECPPEHNPQAQTVLYKDNAWRVFDILIGQSYFDEYGLEKVITECNFELPEHHTFDAPPSPKDRKHALKLVNQKWMQLLDYRGEMAYAKARDGDDYQIESLGDIPDTHTLIEPDIYDSWIDEKWQYDVERHRPFKITEERQWRNNELGIVLARIDQYEREQSYVEELRTSPLSSEQYQSLLQDRKALCDYPAQNNFPFCERPTLAITSIEG